MLAAMEDLLDSWPGTLVVVSHDRYFLERVTDQQYAILGGRFRHLPGGVDEYLKLRAATPVVERAQRDETPAASSPALAGAERRAAEKELSAIDRRLAKLQTEIAALDARFADAHDDYDRLQELQRTRDAYVTEVATLEERWLELGEALDD
jgi:ATPase subunit of ABC transporter with duplicated ATPase domains